MLSTLALARRIDAGELSPPAVVELCAEAIAAREGEIGAFVALDLDAARRAAAAPGLAQRPLRGLPFGIKDIFDTVDFPTQYGTPIYAGHRPKADAAMVALVRRAGGIVLGKTVTTEFASLQPAGTRNPRNPAHTPGGSSSGSAAAVAAGMVPLAIGSQTNGSMIRPAAFCGVFGVKPSHGLISRAGALSLSRTLDHVGAFARSLDDLALILDVLVAEDAADPDSRPFAAPGFRAAAAEPPPLTPSFAFVRTPIWDKADPEARSALEDLAKELGAREVDLPADYGDAWPALRAVMAAEMAHNLGHHVDTGGEVSPQFRALIEEGRKVTATEYMAAVRGARHYAEGMMGIFEQYADAILTLSAPGIAPKGTATGNPMVNTLWTLVGFPALNLPLLANADGLPIGVQLVGAHGRDERLLRTAGALVQQFADAE